MAYDFETLLPAINDDSPMRRQLKAGGFPDDVIDYGVAEMKFQLLDDVKKSIVGLVENGVLGYSAGDDRYDAAVKSWMKSRHGWDVESQWITQTYGIVQAIGISIRALTNPGDKILIQTPVYNPFAAQIKSNGRTVVENPLTYTGSRYEIDFDDFEKKIKDVKMFILCSPHNPVCRVWSKEELSKMASLCAEKGVVVVSDEIHNDLVYGREHTVFATVSQEAADISIICTSPSKTFNIPGLTLSNIIIKNEDLRAKFKAQAELTVGHFVNPVGARACTSAYEHGAAWVDELCSYLEGNYETMKKLLAEKVPGAVLTEMEGTYLAWIDMSFLGYDYDRLEKFITKEALLPVNMGLRYGDSAANHIRVNIGCPRRYVEDFVDRLAKAVNER